MLRFWKAVALFLALLCVLLTTLLVCLWRIWPDESLRMFRHVRTTQEDGFFSKDISVGTLYLFAGEVDPLPDGWVLCAGQELSQSDYPSLYSVIGDRHTRGAPAVGSFALPDMRGSAFFDLRAIPRAPWVARVLPWFSCFASLQLGPSAKLQDVFGAEHDEALKQIESQVFTPVSWVVKAR